MHKPICESLTEDIPGSKDVCNRTMLTNIIMKIFTNVKKSVRNYSIGKIRIIYSKTLDSSNVKIQDISFKAVLHMKSSECFLIVKSESDCKLDCMLKETYNGNLMMIETSISKDDIVPLFLAGKMRDLYQFNIFKLFVIANSNDLFCDCKIISMRPGYHYKNKEQLFKYVGEQKDTEPKVVIKSINVLNEYSIGSVSHAFKRCIVCEGMINQGLKQKQLERQEYQKCLSRCKEFEYKFEDDSDKIWHLDDMISNVIGKLEGSKDKSIDDQDNIYNRREYKRKGMPGSMINEHWCKVQDQKRLCFENNIDISNDEPWSTFESRLIRLYRNVIRNETSRMMSSIDMVGIEAEHLFGLERSRIFFNLLDEELCHFGSTEAISEFVPNMAESTVRQHVISFFEHARDITSRLIMTLLKCPDSKILQQMPVQNFTSLMKSVIKSSLKAQSKGRQKLSLERNIYTMVDRKDFERALGEEIPEDVLNRLRNEDEMVVLRFVDTRLERQQPSNREENRPIHITYFPSDCRLFISIPTENRSYWHHLDIMRAYRIRQHIVDK